MFRHQFITAAAAIVLAAGNGFAAEKAGELMKKEFNRLISGANTKQDHRRLAAHFKAKAERYDAEAVEHLALAKTYRSHPTGSEVKRPMAPDTAGHCDYIAGVLTDAAKGSRRLAAEHEAMAK